VLACALFVLPPPAPIVLLGAFLLIGGWEWSGFFLANKTLQRISFVLVLGMLAAALAYALWSSGPLDIVLFVAVLWWLVIAVWLILGRINVTPAGCALAGLMGLLPAWYAVLRLFGCEGGALLFVWIVAIVAAADIGAYFTGRSLGRTKLAPAISPGKTREGLLGGLIGAAVVSAAGASMLDANVVVFTLAGAAIALVSVVGDLTVSAFKRSAGLKDSGRILPGHGGVMDRIDSLIAALPLFVLILSVTGILSSTVCTGI